MFKKPQAALLSTLIGGLITLSAQTSQAAGLVQCAEQERCYGVSKAGLNDCSTSTSACSGTAKKDNQKDSWIYVPKGTCEKIAGSTLAKPTAPTKKP